MNISLLKYKVIIVFNLFAQYKSSIYNGLNGLTAQHQVGTFQKDFTTIYDLFKHFQSIPIP